MIHYIVTIERLSIEGPEPTPRSMQTALFYKKYIVMFGGRTSQRASNYLNDLILLDLEQRKWVPIVVYGFSPSKRWGHSMAIQNNELLVFGGVAETRLASATIYALEVDPEVIKQNLEECEKFKSILEAGANKANILK